MCSNRIERETLCRLKSEPEPEKMKAAPTANTPNWSTWIVKNMTDIFTQGKTYSMMGYMVARYVGWIVLTTGFITFCPLLLEVRREAYVEQLEQAQINDAISKGATPQELVYGGLTSAVDPKVVNG